MTEKHEQQRKVIAITASGPIPKTGHALAGEKSAPDYDCAEFKRLLFEALALRKRLTELHAQEPEGRFYDMKLRETQARYNMTLERMWAVRDNTRKHEARDN
jgi:hypothetical protein